MAVAFAAGSAALSCGARLTLTPRSIHINARHGSSDSITSGGIHRSNIAKPPAASAAAHHPATSTSTSSPGSSMLPMANINAVPQASAPGAAGDVMVPLSALSAFFSKTSLAELDVLLEEVTSSLVLPADQRPWSVHGVDGRHQKLLGSVSMDADGVIRQRFAIPSYEIGADQTASIETLMKYLQEISLNHASMAGLLADGFGRTFEMSKRGLIWAVTKIQIQVERFPCWGDVIEVESWIAESGKNGKRRDWLVRDCSTGQIITRATSVWVTMNKETRKLSKMPEEVREELRPVFVEWRPCVLDADIARVPKLDADEADYACRGLSPGWGDLDVNQHVNNVKYISWILDSVPVSLLETHQMAGMTLEYRKECGRDSVLNSLTNAAAQGSLEPWSPDSLVECHHLLQLDDGKAEILRGRTQWRPKQPQQRLDILSR